MDKKEIISVKNLHKEFGSFIAVKNIDFEVFEGEIFGFLGPNGAGKSTTINMLTTVLPLSSGSINIAGFDSIKQAQKVRGAIGVIPQNNSLEPELTAYENLEYYGRLYHMKQGDIKERIIELLKIVGLLEKKDILVKNYSGGMRRRLEIAKSFIHNPKIIFMDEPTTGLDAQTKQSIWDHIKRLNKENNVTIFITTHYLEEADALCDRIAIIDHGEIIALDTAENLKDMIGEGDMIDVTTDKPDEFVKIVKKITKKIQKDKKRIRLFVDHGEKKIPQIMKLCEKKVKIESISFHEPTMEDVFFHFTGRSLRE